MRGEDNAASRSLRNVKQRASHAHLSRDVSLSAPPPVRSRRGHLDAIIVPASRPASFLEPVIRLAGYLGVVLVVLCSKQTKVDQVAQRVARTPAARSLIVSISDTWKHCIFPVRTSDWAFHVASGYRTSDLSLKRNLGLLLARLHGWNKIAFVDDDITLRRIDGIARLAGQLDRYQVAGMRAGDFPDNSVVCHARRLAEFWQDVFITGAVLGVHCGDLPLSYFPDIYNEDWFFFAEDAAARQLPRVGEAKQAEYDPFASLDRARREEFGDLLAEGLYALIGDEDPTMPFDDQLRGATRRYWERFMDARRHVIGETRAALECFRHQNTNTERISNALASLAAAETQLNSVITPELCVDFLQAWRDDLDDWQRFTNRVSNVGSTREAMDFLELNNWRWAEFGASLVESQTLPNTITFCASAGGPPISAAQTARGRVEAVAPQSARSREPHRQAERPDYPPGPKATGQSLPNSAQSRIGRA